MATGITPLHSNPAKTSPNSTTDVQISIGDKMDPNGKIALVTGSAQGIGFAIAKALLQNGVKGVTLIDVNVSKGENAAQELQQEFGRDRVIFMKADVTKENELEGAFKQTIEHFGHLDIVVNNAAIFDARNWQKMVSVNVNGIFLGTILALKYLGKDQLGKGGVVINTGSDSGLGAGLSVFPVYNGTKTAIIGFTRSFSSDFHWQTTGVRVLCVSPGYTATEIVAGDKDISSLILRKEWYPQFQREMEVHTPPQRAENVGRGVIHAIREGKSGSLWVSEDDKPVYEIAFPHYRKMKV